jgi:hypothetical protein
MALWYLSSSLALHFSDYSFCGHHSFNRDNRQLLAHAMASEFSVANTRLKKFCFSWPLRSLPISKISDLHLPAVFFIKMGQKFVRKIFCRNKLL